MPGTTVRPENAAGNRRTSEETKQKLRAKAQERWNKMTPEEQEAQRARLRRPGSPPPTNQPPAPGNTNGGPTSLFEDAPGAHPRPARPVAPGASNGHDRASGPPIFRVPELTPLELGSSPLPGVGGEPVPIGTEIEGGPPPGVQVTQEQVATLLRFPFELASLRRGDHWKLREDETAMVAEPLTRKINENAIAARALAAGGDWAVIVGGLAVIVSGRVAEDQRRERDRAEHDEPRSGRVPAGNDGRRGDAPGLADARRPGGSLNGYATVAAGPADDERAQAVDPEAAGHPLAQAL